MDEPSPAPDTSSRPEPVEGFALHRDGRPIQAARLFFPARTQTYWFFRLYCSINAINFSNTSILSSFNNP